MNKKIKSKKSPFSYFASNEKNIISINFKRLFGEETEIFSKFHIVSNSKKLYGKDDNRNRIIDGNNKFLRENPSIAENFLSQYYSIRKNINSNSYMKDSKNFRADIIGLLFPIGLLKRIHEYCKKYESYSVSPSTKRTYKSKQYNPSITFEKHHFHILYMASVATRLIIPLAMEYIYTRSNFNGTEFDQKKFLSLLFANILTVIEDFIGKNTNIYMKIYSYVETKVNRTYQSDNPIFKKMEFRGNTFISITEDIVNNYIITNIIPKIDLNKNVITFIDTVIKHTIKNKCRENFKLEDSGIQSDNKNSLSDDNNIINEVELSDSFMTTPDQKIILLRKIFIHPTIQKIKSHYHLNNKEEEIQEQINFYYDTLPTIHNFQKFIILQSFANDFGGSQNIHACSKREFVELLVILLYKLDYIGLTEIKKYATSIYQGYIIRRTNKQFQKTIEEHPDYIEIVEKKYKFISNILQTNNFIIKIIQFLVQGKFAYNEFNGLENGNIIERDEDKIISMILTFIKLFII